MQPLATVNCSPLAASAVGSSATTSGGSASALPPGASADVLVGAAVAAGAVVAVGSGVFVGSDVAVGATVAAGSGVSVGAAVAAGARVAAGADVAGGAASCSPLPCAAHGVYTGIGVLVGNAAAASLRHAALNHAVATNRLNSRRCCDRFLWRFIKSVHFCWNQDSVHFFTNAPPIVDLPAALVNPPGDRKRVLRSCPYIINLRRGLHSNACGVTNRWCASCETGDFARAAIVGDFR